MRIEEKIYNKLATRLVSDPNDLKPEDYVRTFIVNDRLDSLKLFHSTCVVMAYPVKRHVLIKKQAFRKKIMGL